MSRNANTATVPPVERFNLFPRFASLLTYLTDYFLDYLVERDHDYEQDRRYCAGITHFKTHASVVLQVMHDSMGYVVD